METDVQVRVLLTCYNYGTYVAQSIESILAQECSFAYEIFIFDDASTDHSWSVIQEYQSRYPDKITAYRPEKNTYQNGLRCGGMAEVAKLPPVRYIAFLEGDDYWSDPHKLQKQYDALESHPECAFCVCDAELYDVVRECRIGMAPSGFDGTWTKDEVIAGLLTQQLSFRENTFFGRADRLQEEDFYAPFWGYWGIDLTKILYFLSLGELYYLPENLTTKRVNNQGTVSDKASQTGQEVIDWKIRHYTEDIEWIRHYDVQTGQRYHDVIRSYIAFRQIKLYYLRRGMLEENRLVSAINGKMYRKSFLRKLNRAYLTIMKKRYGADRKKYAAASAGWMEKEWKKLESRQNKISS